MRVGVALPEEPPINQSRGQIHLLRLRRSYLTVYCWAFPALRRDGNCVEKGFAMAQGCDVCGKTASKGNQVETRGKAKYLGGVGTKITGISRRHFRPNLQTIKAITPTGTTRTMRVCTTCIRSGFVRKAVKRRPFKLLPGEQAQSANVGAAPAEKSVKSKPVKAKSTKPKDGKGPKGSKG